MNTRFLVLFLSIQNAVIKDDQWYPAIGDDSFLGWFTVVAYFFTSIIAAISTINTSHLKLSGKQLENHRLIWGLIAVTLLFLGINKQLDLQTWLTLKGKQIALVEGFYDERRTIQGIFILSIVFLGILYLVFLFWLVSNSTTNTRWGLIGLGMLICFVIIRAASFHHIDYFIGISFSNIRVNNILELGGIGTIALFALKNIKSHG